MDKKIQISKREHTKGEDGYKVFSIRIKDELADKLDRIAVESNRSRNDLIAMFLEYCVENYEVVE